MKNETVDIMTNALVDLMRCNGASTRAIVLAIKAAGALRSYAELGRKLGVSRERIRVCALPAEQYRAKIVRQNQWRRSKRAAGRL